MCPHFNSVLFEANYLDYASLISLLCCSLLLNVIVIITIIIFKGSSQTVIVSYLVMQYEDDVPPYLDTTKMLYKDLVR